MAGGPAAEITIDIPRWSTAFSSNNILISRLRLTPVGEGWDNVVFRLATICRPAAEACSHSGDDGARTAVAPEAGAAAAVAVPIVRCRACGIGASRGRGPVPRFPGTSAVSSPPRHLRAAAVTLGPFSSRTPPACTGQRAYAVLAQHSTRCPHAVSTSTSTPSAMRVDRERVAGAPGSLVVTLCWPGPPIWIHGDPHWGPVGEERRTGCRARLRRRHGRRSGHRPGQ